MVYDVDQMLKKNRKVVTDEVTSKDIDPVLLLWDKENQTWYEDIFSKKLWIKEHETVDKAVDFPSKLQQHDTY